jgi:hypothetical protein
MLIIPQEEISSSDLQRYGQIGLMLGRFEGFMAVCVKNTIFGGTLMV